MQNSAASKQEKDIVSTEFDVGQRIIFVTNQSNEEKFIPIEKSSNQNKDDNKNEIEIITEQIFSNEDNNENIKEISEVSDNEITTEILLDENYEIEYSQKPTKEKKEVIDSNFETTEKYFSGINISKIY